ncbi:unnamed protein product [Phaedon cochleariae]|uniref:Uncharacterized protein n=1 Tax=Phaedon cochleariae TaxID=80249 RepID=A0A9N9X0I6_PHACE|nr:unnamed protein product [Phaedon cochleariae]
MNLMKSSDTSNCEEDDDVNLMTIPSKTTTSTASYLTEGYIEVPGDPPSTENSIDNEIFPSSSSSSDEEDSSSDVTLEDCSNSYFAGYLAKKCVEKFECNKCKEFLIVDDTDIILNDPKQLLIINKNYGTSIQHLKYPGDDLKSLVERALTYFSKTFNKKPYRNKTRLFIKNQIFKKLHKKCQILQRVECKEHMDFIVDHLILCKLYRECKEMSKYNKKSETKKHQKLSILKS